MQGPTETAKPACAFCGAPAETAVSPASEGPPACLRCTARLGHLLARSPGDFAGVWPVLAEEEEDLEPEPQVRDAQGNVRELRAVTAELKRELTPEARAQLAEAYGLMGMHREQVQECALLLEGGDPALVERALALLFSPRLCAPTAVAQLRSRLFPS